MQKNTLSKRKPAFKGPLSGKEAEEAVKKFRDKHKEDLETFGIVYEMSDILNYLANVFIPFAEANKPTNKDEKWVVGHYFMIHDNKLNFCVVPTLYNEDNNTIIDRYDHLKITRISFPEYADSFEPNQTKSDPPGDGEPFDKGGMWP